MVFDFHNSGSGPWQANFHVDAGLNFRGYGGVAWVNGRLVVDHEGPTLYEGQGVYLKLANYHSPFGQASSVIHDRVIRGRTALSVSDLPLEGVLDIVDGVLTNLL